MPTRQQIHIDRALTNISVAYMQDASNFIADKVFPIVPVQKQSDLYFIYKREDFLRDEAEERANGTESAGGDYNVDQSEPYFCRVVAFHKDVTEQDRVNADEPLNPDQDATEFVSGKLLIRREVQWAEKFFVTGKWGTEIVGKASNPSTGETLQWDQSTSDPVKTVKNAATTMQENTGFRPNTLVLSPYVKDALLEHPDIIDRIKYTQKGIASIDLLAELFEVKNVHIAQAIYNKAQKGATEDTEFIMGKHALLCYSEPKPGLKKPSAGYTFAWKGLKGAGAFGNRVVRIPMPWLGMDTERIEGEMAYDMKQVAADLGTFFKDIVA
jgi:hypothetical protein